MDICIYWRTDYLSIADYIIIYYIVPICDSNRRQFNWETTVFPLCYHDTISQSINQSNILSCTQEHIHKKAIKKQNVVSTTGGLIARYQSLLSILGMTGQFKNKN